MVRRLAVVLLVPAMLIAGCNGGDDDVASSTTFAPPATNPPLPTSSTMGEASGEDDPTTTSTDSVDTTAPTTSDAVTTSTSTSVVTVTTVPDDTTVSTDPDEFDWVAIVQGLYDTLDDINAAPDVSRIDEFCVVVESPCRSAQGAQVEALVRDGWRVVDIPRTEVLAASFVATADGKPPLESTLVILAVELAEAEDGGQVVDADGTVLFEITAGDGLGGPASWFVRHIAGVGWRVFEIS